MTTTRTTATYALDLDGLIYIEDADCAFDVEIEVSPREPFSWGGSRGTETEVSATVTAVTLGKLTLTRAQAVLMFGEDAIERAERAAEDRVMEEGPREIAA